MLPIVIPKKTPLCVTGVKSLRNSAPEIIEKYRNTKRIVYAPELLVHQGTWFAFPDGENTSLLQRNNIRNSPSAGSGTNIQSQHTTAVTDRTLSNIWHVHQKGGM